MLNFTGKLKLDIIIQVSFLGKQITSNSTTCGQKVLNCRFSAFHALLYWLLEEIQ